MNLSKVILLAEDDDDDQVFFNNALKAVCPDCSLSIVSNGRDVIELVGPGKPLPDIIVLDIGMPEMDGLKCLKVIREQAHLRNVKVVMLTVSKRDTVLSEAYTLGADLFMVKPNTYEELKKVVREILQ